LVVELLVKSFGALIRTKYEVAYLAFELDLLFIVVRRIPFREPGFAPRNTLLVFVDT